MFNAFSRNSGGGRDRNSSSGGSSSNSSSGGATGAKRDAGGANAAPAKAARYSANARPGDAARALANLSANPAGFVALSGDSEAEDSFAAQVAAAVIQGALSAAATEGNEAAAHELTSEGLTGLQGVGGIPQAIVDPAD